VTLSRCCFKGDTLEGMGIWGSRDGGGCVVCDKEHFIECHVPTQAARLRILLTHLQSTPKVVSDEWIRRSKKGCTIPIVTACLRPTLDWTRRTNDNQLADSRKKGGS
jgi:hypothetical protein